MVRNPSTARAAMTGSASRRARVASRPRAARRERATARRSQAAGGILPEALLDHARDVRVRHLPREPHFGEQALDPARALGACVRDQLKGHGLAQDEVVDAVHLAHSAGADQADHAVAFGEHRARRVSPTVGGRRSGGGARRRRAPAVVALTASTPVRPWRDRNATPSRSKIGDRNRGSA